MGRVYLNKKDIEVLNKIRNMNLVDDIKNVLDDILKKEKETRLHINSVSKEYKRKKRAIDKNYARSKKEKEGAKNGKNK